MIQSKDLKILVVDDQDLDRNALAECVRSLGFEVILAESGPAALETLEKSDRDIQLVFTDRQMPGMSGIELVKNIKNFDSRIDVVVVTAQADIDSAVEAIQAGASNYIVKPIKKEDVKKRVEHLAQKQAQLKLGGVQKDLTVFFCDIKNFTELAEKTDSQMLTQFLNRFLSVMTDILRAERGTLDKYIGDAIMAYWDLEGQKNLQAELAVKAGLGMIEKLKDINHEFSQTLGFIVDIGIGVNSGPVSVGNFGSDKAYEFTVIGDNVNMASRLESINRTYGTRLLVSESSYALLGHGEIQGREIDRVKVKGKLKPVKIFEIFLQAEAPSKETLEQFALGLQSYRSQNWKAALSFFESILKQRERDGPSLEFIKRCENYLVNPPESDWDGVWRF